MAFDIDAWARSPAGRRFHFFDPVLTYSSPDNDRFIEVNGKTGKELNPDTDALFRIGEEAFARLAQGKEFSKDEFENAYAAYWAALDGFRDLLSELRDQGQLLIKNENGAHMSVDISALDDTQIASICWQFYSGSPRVLGRSDETKEVYWQLFLFHALREVDNSLIGIALDGREAVVAAIGAANALSNAIAIESGSEKEQEFRRDMAYRGAIEKLKRDPKQMAKAKVKECWDEWQLKPTNYKGKSAFAKDMMTKFEELDSQPVITRWCSQWEKEAAK